MDAYQALHSLVRLLPRFFPATWSKGRSQIEDLDHGVAELSVFTSRNVRHPEKERFAQSIMLKLGFHQPILIAPVDFQDNGPPSFNSTVNCTSADLVCQILLSGERVVLDETPRHKLLRGLNFVNAKLSTLNLSMEHGRPSRQHRIQGDFSGAGPFRSLLENIWCIDLAESKFDPQQIEALIDYFSSAGAHEAVAVGDIIRNPDVSFEIVRRLEEKALLARANNQRYLFPWLCTARNIHYDDYDRFASRISVESLDQTIDNPDTHPAIRKLLRKRRFGMAQAPFKNLKMDSIRVGAVDPDEQPHLEGAEFLVAYPFGYNGDDAFPRDSLRSLNRWWHPDATKVRLTLYWRCNKKTDEALEAFVVADIDGKQGVAMGRIMNPLPVFAPLLPGLLRDCAGVLRRESYRLIEQAKKCQDKHKALELAAADFDKTQ